MGRKQTLGTIGVLPSSVALRGSLTDPGMIVLTHESVFLSVSFPAIFGCFRARRKAAFLPAEVDYPK